MSTTGIPDLTETFRAMATDVTLRVVAPGPGAPQALRRAREVIEQVARSCTRFDPDSALMRANAAGRSWCAVPPECYRAVEAAAVAHRATAGAFDPRVLTTLADLGYDRSLPFAAGEVAVAVDVAGADGDGPTGHRPGRRAARPGLWRPGLDPRHGRVRVGPRPIDLGGIGKGLAVGWAAAQLRGTGGAWLVSAGGDVAVGGPGPDRTGWSVGVEDPHGATEPVAVLRLADAAVATSSTRVRRWRVGDRAVHHLIDPRTGAPAAGGLAAVTVVGPDPAWAEVWSKTLFLAGRRGIRARAAEAGLAALWVAADGYVGTTPALRRHLVWQVRRAA